MYHHPLAAEDKKTIVSELTQILIAFTFISIILALAIVTGVTLLQSATSDFISSNKTILISLVILVPVIILILVAALKLRKPIGDLSSGIKLCMNGIVTDKKTNTNYGWHGSAGADMISQPKLVEYFLYVDGVSYLVSQETFEQMDKGSKVELSFTSQTKKLIKVEKV